MRKVVIQIAGIRTIEDACAAAECGFDIIGLLVGQKHNSDDFITKEQAKEIKLHLPSGVQTTLITHVENATQIIDMARFIDVDYIQLHSSILEDEVEKIHKALPDKKLIRVIHINNNKILTDVEKFRFADYYLTDSINTSTDQVGGTGLVHDYTVDKKLVATLKKPVFVAGGLTSENVADVIKTCMPYGVDVNSGCRGINGYRDKNKMEAFVNRVRGIK